ncbi:MAG: trigger factor [Bacteroidota bacterium]
MIITKESTGDLTATIKIELEPVDYQEQVDVQLKDYQRKANLPGFRPGKVPYGMVKKMYGKAVLFDTVNKAYSDALQNYLTESKDELLGSPLANHEKNKAIDLDSQTNYSFYFDIAYAPDFKVDINNSIEVNYYNIQITDETVDKYMDEVRRRYSNFESVDLVEENDMVSGTFEELDEQGQVKEGGIKNDTFIYMEQVKDEKSKKKLLGLKVGDTVEAEPKKLARNNLEEAYFLGIKKEQLPSITSKFRFSIKLINRSTLAELNEEFFSKVYPDQNVTTVEEMRERVRSEASEGFLKEGERKFMSDVTESILEKHAFELPDEFLKRFMLETEEDKKFTKEQVESEYDQSKKIFKWQLIENKIVKENNLQVARDEIKDFVKGYFINAQVHNHEHEADHDHEEDNKRFDQIAETIMQNKDEVKRIHEKLFTDKLFDYFKSSVTVKEQNISYDDFIKLIDTPKS